MSKCSMHSSMLTILLIFAIANVICVAFSFKSSPPALWSIRRSQSTRSAVWIPRRNNLERKCVDTTRILNLFSFDDDQNESYSPSQIDGRVSRRNALLSASSNIGLAASILAFGSQSSSAADQAANEGKNLNSNELVLVIGANGRTGSECVSALVERKIPVRPATRTGSLNNFPNLAADTAKCDVTDPSSIANCVKGCQGVIFAASASKAGGTPGQVDNVGLVNVAKACIEAKVPRLIVVSSGAVTKPSSPVYLFLNLFGGIMAEKIKGEDTVRQLYSGQTESSYTIIRPGGLTEDTSLGVSAIELNQGDSKSGRIARSDVALLCVESIINPENTAFTTFECYYADTGAPLATVGLSNIMKSKTDKQEVFISGKERRGSTWKELFTGLEKDGRKSVLALAHKS